MTPSLSRSNLGPNAGASAQHGELARALRAFRGAFYSAGGFSLAVNLLLLVPAVYMLQVYDRVITSRNEATLYVLTFIMLGLLLMEAALEWVRSRMLVRTSSALDVKLSGRVFEASFERALAGHGAQATQSLGDVTNVRQFLTGTGVFAFFDAPWTPIYIAVIFLLHPVLGVFAVAAAVVLVSLTYANERLTGRMLTEAGHIAQSADAYAANTLRNAEVIEAMGMLSNLRSRWLARELQFLALQGKASDRAGAISATTRFFRIAFQSCTLGLGALLVIGNELTPGGMIAASILLGRALAPVELAIGNWRNVVSARAAYHRLEALLAAYPARRASLALPRPKGAVEAENLVVAAPGERDPILKRVNFTVAPGATVAVVGPSASGKSTLARALVGVWAPLAGAVRLDGAEVHRRNKGELGPCIGYLPQDVELFEGTIAENIARFGELDAERIVRAAQRAGVHELVLRMPHGYETLIGEGGSTLSGGQRQRIALARALYGDPPLVVLDEPNANLDDAGDAALLGALRELKQSGSTVFVMTHRINVLSLADFVLVLGDGMVKAFGPRQAVLRPLKPQGRPEQLGPQERKEGVA